MSVVLGSYVGSYFLCVCQMRVGFTRGDHVEVVPAYRYVPASLDAVAVYRPVHLLDRTFLRRSIWQTRPARNGELSGFVVGPRRVLFSVPFTNAP
jgi:hypothetical protein